MTIGGESFQKKQNQYDVIYIQPLNVLSFLMLILALALVLYIFLDCFLFSKWLPSNELMNGINY